jgi:sec-independent protein translocase protein TatB
MFSLTPSELLTIGVVALIVFGPRRLPELAKRAGQMVSYLRSAADELKGAVEGELDDVAAPIREAAHEISSQGKSLRDAAKGELDDVTKPFREAASGLAAEGKTLRETAKGELKWVDEDPT